MQCDTLKPGRKSVAIITSTMAHVFRAEMLSHFSSLLADRGWDITIITHNRQGFFDFLVEERVHRFSMDNVFHKESERQEILAKFVQITLGMLYILKKHKETNTKKKLN